MAIAKRQDNRKEIRYLNKDFSSFRNSLMDFAKVYFPNTYNDFNESSPGMMFIEMAAYVGDVLSYYVDSQFKEMMLGYAEERKNVIALAQSFGYTPKTSVGASTNVDVFSVVPSIGSGDSWGPDLRYGIVIKDGMLITPKEDPSLMFRTVDDCNFKFSSSFDPMEVSVYEYDNVSKEPQRYLLKKTVEVIAGQVKEENFPFTEPDKYAKILLAQDDVIEIISVVDSNGKTWYEVPYLAQDTVFVDIENSAANDPELTQYNDSAPYMLKLRKTPRRFIKRVRDDNKTELQFGAGISSNPDEVLIPNPANIAQETIGTPVNLLNNAFDPSNFLKTKTYGQVPHNLTLTVKYSYGGGVHTNVQANTLTEIQSSDIVVDSEGLESGPLETARGSIACINPEPATGGRSSETLEEIRSNALAYFSSQNRCVTKEDYIVRTYSMPAKYGSVAKAYIVQDEQLNQSNYTRSESKENKKNKKKRNNVDDGRTNKLPTSYIPNPLALNLYTLGYDGDKKLINLSPAVKENLKLYLGQYRMLTDAVNIKNAYIINIGVDFEIITLRGYNKREVLLRCVKALKDFFDIDSWQINQPVSIADIIYELGLIEGVQTVTDVEIKNLWDENLGYSGNIYDIDEAIRNKVLYPSMDPSIFEIRFPNQDIQGKVQEG
tara:strand:+ start:1418 stop:3397 length:1980 start_codon:yes stop_codon:yes gene_type:complete